MAFDLFLTKGMLYHSPPSSACTTTVFGTPLDVTLSELALECFYPADEVTRILLLSQVPDNLVR